ncbi:dephospho-CoA kinase [Flavobacterium sp.]|uniref:dephospho-CoA kinase n=1 Tax=Flavobacterium sp. TaxID=239 RepID=UPI00261A266E|nr:dephospho-CoA kinase [Flavobacterium sp.]MDD3003968.1 dephospho-CoA kinase [Flavobacterium sp.]
MTKIIGLTGGIGSGKSTVAAMFEKLGIPVYIADEEAKKITNKSETLALIQKQFGSEVIVNNQLNRPLMAEIVFKDPTKLEQLNAIIHPLVAEDFKKWLKLHQSQPFVIKEAAILLESAKPHNCDYIITVTAPLAIRIKRVEQRDGLSEAKILERVNNQWSDEQRIEKSNFVIENVNINETKRQVSQIFEKLTKKFQ